MRKRGRARTASVVWRNHYMRYGLFAAAGIAALFGVQSLWNRAVLIERTGFPFKVLRVEGAFEHVTTPQLAAIIGPYAAAGFFEADVQAVKQALEDLPWVGRASVRRVWPDVLHVTVTEERAAARWGDEGLVNPAGQVFYPEEKTVALKNLPLLEGPPRTSAQVMNAFMKFSEQMAPLRLGVVRLSMDARRAWRLTLSNGMELTLGRKDGERQIERFVRFYPGTLDGRIADVEQVDLRYGNGFAVKWRQPAGAAVRRPYTGNTGDDA